MDDEDYKAWFEPRRQEAPTMTKENLPLVEFWNETVAYQELPLSWDNLGVVEQVLVARLLEQSQDIKELRERIDKLQEKP